MLVVFILLAGLLHGNIGDLLSGQVAVSGGLHEDAREAHIREDTCHLEWMPPLMER